MRGAGWILAAMAAWMLGAAPARAGDDAAVFAVAYIDVTPSAQTNATRLLRQERALGRKDDGNLRFDVFMEVARPTRFLLLSVWRDPKAAEAHAAADHTKQFRAALDAIRVTPFATHVLTLLAGDQVTGPTGRPAAGTAAIYVVTHFDSIPPFKDEAAGALKQLAEASRKESGAVQYQALQQTNRPNHFKLIEVWKDQSAYNAHVAAAHTKQFRDFVQQGAGSPYDERLYKLID